MRASLIFSSTSHSINVQKVTGPQEVIEIVLPICLVLSRSPLDIQDRALQSFRSQMYHPGDREHRRAALDLPIGCLAALDYQNIENTNTL